MKPQLIVLFWLFSLPEILAQEGTLDTYIRQALDHSPLLDRQELAITGAEAGLREAKGYYLPEVSFGGTYTLASGGRTIQLPIGDLLNPVYSTLNLLTQTNAFPSISNTEEQFLPNNFYDARFRVTQPLYNPAIPIQKNIRQEQLGLAQSSLQLSKRDLVAQVKGAYYQYLQAGEAVAIFDKALLLLEESRRVNESLIRNGMALPSAQVRTEAEIITVQAQRQEALNNQTNARAYFNYLIGQPFNAPLAIDTSLWQLPAYDPNATAEPREELAQLQTLASIQSWSVELEKRYRMPQLGLQVDLGSQNFDFDWGGYVLAGVSLQVPLWDGGRHSNRLQQAQVSLQSTQIQLEDTRQAFELQAFTARQSLESALAIQRSFEAQIASAERLYRETDRRYRESQANYIELLDARTQLTTAELQASIARLNAWQRYNELERALASYPIP